MTERPILIMAGGTGGHIFPALAVARVLRGRGIPVIWLGAKGKMEGRIVPPEGFELIEIDVGGWRGQRGLAALMGPLRLVRAVAQALRALRKYKPRAALGMGGFAAGPGGIAAAMLRIPLYIHEQNAIPGMTNRWLARFATRVMEGFPGSFGDAAVFTGNPVRAEIATLRGARAESAGHGGALRLFVVGGSLGARKLNDTVPRALALLPAETRPEVWHQSGAQNYESTLAAYAAAGVAARVDAFISDMAEPYGWADVAIARAGALTVTELAHAGLPAILVPYPHAVDDHQTANARALVERGAALLIPDQELTPERLAAVLFDLNRDREVLANMAQAGAGFARVDAAEQVADICLGDKQAGASMRVMEVPR